MQSGTRVPKLAEQLARMSPEELAHVLAAVDRSRG